MFKKGTKLYSILNNKCPRCHEGYFFTERNIFPFKKILNIHDNCSHCELKYMIEPSFYYGAMYVNYGISVAMSVATFIIAFVLLNLDMLQSFVAVVIVLILLSIPTMRLSRIIWINMFVGYKKGSPKSLN